MPSDQPKYRPQGEGRPWLHELADNVRGPIAGGFYQRTGLPGRGNTGSRTPQLQYKQSYVPPNSLNDPRIFAGREVLRRLGVIWRGMTPEDREAWRFGRLAYIVGPWPVFVKYNFHAEYNKIIPPQQR